MWNFLLAEEIQIQQLKERKSKLLTENEMGHLVQKSYFAKHCQFR